LNDIIVTGTILEKNLSVLLRHSRPIGGASSKIDTDNTLTKNSITSHKLLVSEFPLVSFLLLSLGDDQLVFLETIGHIVDINSVKIDLSG
jgi:hypothetical protein